MNTYLIQFAEFDSDESFSRLAHSLHAKAVNSVIQIPAPEGKGVVRKIAFENGLSMRAWDLQMNGSLIFEKKADRNMADKIFQVACVFNSDPLTIKRTGQYKGLKIETSKNLLFISSDADISFEIEPGKLLQAIDISVTGSWLLQAFNDAEMSFVSFINQLRENPHPIAVFESSTVAEYRTLSEIHRIALSDEKGTLQIKAELLSLLSDFFGRIFSWSSREMMGSRVLYYDKMMMVEKILMSHLQTTLPSIESIARQVALSESTLKRHFKVMFGKSVYEYYLEIKMDFAKRMLLEKPLTVNEVAAMLDYEKVSNFIGMFKKHHGFSPGSIRRGQEPRY